MLARDTKIGLEQVCRHPVSGKPGGFSAKNVGQPPPGLLQFHRRLITSTRPSARVPAMPTTTPMSVGRMPSKITMRSTSATRACRAKRMPISRRRRRSLLGEHTANTGGRRHQRQPGERNQQQHVGTAVGIGDCDHFIQGLCAGAPKKRPSRQAGPMLPGLKTTVWAPAWPVPLSWRGVLAHAEPPLPASLWSRPRGLCPRHRR